MDITSLPYGSVAIVVNEANGQCSFHIRERSKTIEAIDTITQVEKLWGESSKAMFALVSRKIGETEVFISCFLFGFNIGEMVAYGSLLDPTQLLVKRFLDGLTNQDRIGLTPSAKTLNLPPQVSQHPVGFRFSSVS
jgi:hypothetical protein